MVPEESMETRMALAEERINAVRAELLAAEARMKATALRVEHACSELGKKIDSSLNARIGARGTIIAALVGVAGIVLGKVFS